MFPLFFDPTFVLLIPAVILAFWAQMKVKTAYSEYSRVLSRKGVTGAQAARALLDQFGMYNVPIQRVAGQLTDHYDPRDKTLHLSEGVYNSTSIAAIGVAAHEVGHAVQHQKNYAPLKFRNAVVPVVGIGSSLAFPLFFLGLLFRGPLLMDVGILLFVGVIIFHLVTLPVEFDASSRALKLLGDTGILGSDEVGGAKAVLNAAALTYVAAAVMAFAQLARLLLLRGMFGNRD
ncbi:MAG: zinc metallopeptidase [Aminobacterium sp.]|uniref:zinc metallopeptidase n=1 Tax=unclassified Aminobacterium TaxID=2685012 RepID=UPI001BCFA586|nr:MULTISPECIES: zinc metallopeptidase [unclassified Aminobacterium]MDD2206470.1 zinc metallopeptidase [Aminobacterium sp.]MDD3426448.1 zinc metallopeptidase [Aminobacterium sp.]MDD3706961.1 zinc metallopeptidase [Aminobacterium sp.]MDD4228195.1 zinc metallopeptidase [Aminobacterium sp.]MDD4551232.1 zinc metallopeptidase [Aminobacterium sp.]